eukprot:1139563-Pelagomonas_calceolata.AAC.2
MHRKDRNAFRQATLLRYSFIKPDGYSHHEKRLTTLDAMLLVVGKASERWRACQGISMVDQESQMELRESYAAEHHSVTPGSTMAKAVATGGRRAGIMGDLGAEETAERELTNYPLFLAGYPDIPGKNQIWVKLGYESCRTHMYLICTSVLVCPLPV